MLFFILLVLTNIIAAVLLLWNWYSIYTVEADARTSNQDILLYINPIMAVVHLLIAIGAVFLKFFMKY